MAARHGTRCRYKAGCRCTHRQQRAQSVYQQEYRQRVADGQVRPRTPVASSVQLRGEPSGPRPVRRLSTPSWRPCRRPTRGRASLRSAGTWALLDGHRRGSLHRVRNDRQLGDLADRLVRRRTPDSPARPGVPDRAVPPPRRQGRGESRRPRRVVGPQCNIRATVAPTQRAESNTATLNDGLKTPASLGLTGNRGWCHAIGGITITAGWSPPGGARYGGAHSFAKLQPGTVTRLVSVPGYRLGAAVFSVAGALTAVDVQNLAGDEGRGF